METLNLSPLDEIKTESDVEQKFILPLLKGPNPIGFGYNDSNFRTKPDIRHFKISKGASSKIYFPDYIINDSGLPLMVIEAKRPKEDLNEAFREARLYASELNSQFRHKLNPCKKILVTDGNNVLAGYFDSEAPEISITYQDITTSSELFFKLVEFCRKSTLFSDSTKILQQVRKDRRYSRPLSLLGGKTYQLLEVKPNTFGETISFQFKGLFNPETHDERKRIVENAYVATKKHLKHVDPIDRIIRATQPISSGYLNTIDDTSVPDEIIEKLSDTTNLKNQLLILVGTVGSGKSTFTDYLKNIAIDDSLKNQTVWLSLNLNNAPVNREEIYNWLKLQLISNLQQAYPNLDYDTKETLLKIYNKEFKALRKGPAAFFTPGSEKYNDLMANKLIEIEANLDVKTKAYIRYFCHQRSRLPIIVLDNCDKRKLDDQLLMFDVASWLKEEFSALVFLPLRDTTYNLHRRQPPLDTVIKDLVFRIDPPLLKEVIYQRVKYALRSMPSDKGILTYTLPNGIKVEYPSSDQGKYLASILRSLFENIYFSRLITGFAGRDVRKGLEIFLDFCKSGHISEADILKIKYSGGQEILPNHLVSRVLLRSNQKYYVEGLSNVKNLFHSEVSHDQPNPFTRLAILSWLKMNYRKQGPSQVVNYHKISKIFQELSSYSFSNDILQIEFEFLLKNRMVITESQSEDNYDIEELVAIAPPGLMHLELLNDINYFAACSEDVWYSEQTIAETITKRMEGEIGNGIYTHATTVENADSLIRYLKFVKDKGLYAKGDEFLDASIIKGYYDLSKPYDIIKKHLKKLQESNLIANYDALEFKPSEVIDCEIVYIQKYGFIVELGLRSAGFIHVSTFRNYMDEFQSLEVGDIISAEILEYNLEHERYKLKYIPT